jgi:hypothetical protein
MFMYDKLDKMKERKSHNLLQGYYSSICLEAQRDTMKKLSQ